LLIISPYDTNIYLVNNSTIKITLFSKLDKAEIFETPIGFDLNSGPV